MRKKLFVIISLLILLVVVKAFFFTTPTYAWLRSYESYRSYSYSEYGFFSGIWHGLIAPFAVIAQIFDNDIVLYSSTNTGFGYNLGFLIGISTVIGGSSRASRRNG
jgi:hypothetical protein